MQAELTSPDKADDLIALHGVDAIAVLVDRIADAVRHCDDQAVDNLDRLLQIVEQRFEEPWRAMRSIGN
ncbi:hypothetical protein EIK56_07935 [Sphingomonas sp. C8-2]|nr:hypothetical protein EIK56_07935 [Sphingomonas sp. C8-2]